LDQYLGDDWQTNIHRTVILKPLIPGQAAAPLSPISDDDDDDAADADLKQIRPHSAPVPAQPAQAKQSSPRPPTGSAFDTVPKGQAREVEAELRNFFAKEQQKIRKTGPSVGMDLFRVRKVTGSGLVVADDQIGGIEEGDLCGVMLVASPKNLEKCGAFATCTAATLQGDKRYLDMLHGGFANEGPPILGKCRPGPADQQGHLTIAGFAGVSRTEAVGTNKRDYKCSVRLSVDLEKGIAKTVWDCGKDVLRRSFELTKDPG
jgi:hypothetical protein